jgi:MFS family permease
MARSGTSTAGRRCVIDAAQPRQSAPWLVLALLLAIHVFNFADRFLITGLIGPLKVAFNVDDGFIGLLIGPAFVLLYVVMGIPIARLADRSSRVRIIAAGCLMWSACTAATGLTTDPWQLALARVGVGVGEACFMAPAYSLIADHFRPERRGFAFAILGLATYIGQIAGVAGGSAIERHYGWQASFFVLGIPGGVLGLLFLLFVREPARTAIVGQAGQVPFGVMMRELVHAPGYLLMMMAFALGTLSGVSFGNWGPELFARSYGVDPAQAKTAFALSFGGAGLIGMLGFGVLVDQMSKRSMEWPARMAAIALFFATACVLVATWSPSFALAKLMAIPSGLMGGGWSIGFITALQYMLPDRYRAAATATFIAATTLLGFLVGPWVTGLVSQSFGNDAASLRIGLSSTIPLGFAGAWLGWLAVKRIGDDRERLAVQAGRVDN